MFSRLFCGAAASFCFVIAAFAQDNGIVKIVRDTAAKCEKAQEYAFEGVMLLEAQRGTAPGRILSKAKVDRKSVV